VTGTGYTAGGVVTSITVTKDTVNDRLDITLGAVSWPTSTITARKAVYYKARGGAATADELVAVNDFGSDVTSTGATFSLALSTVRFQN
jgi:phage protein D